MSNKSRMLILGIVSMMCLGLAVPNNLIAGELNFDDGTEIEGVIKTVKGAISAKINLEPGLPVQGGRLGPEGTCLFKLEGAIASSKRKPYSTRMYRLDESCQLWLVKEDFTQSPPPNISSDRGVFSSRESQAKMGRRELNTVEAEKGNYQCVIWVYAHEPSGTKVVSLKNDTTWSSDELGIIQFKIRALSQSYYRSWSIEGAPVARSEWISEWDHGRTTGVGSFYRLNRSLQEGKRLDVQLTGIWDIYSSGYCSNTFYGAAPQGFYITAVTNTKDAGRE